MKKPNLISALAIAAVTATSLTLPATASATSYTREEVRVVRDDHQRNPSLHRVHDVDRRYIKRHRDYRGHGHSHSRWAPTRHHHDRGHHYGHKHKHQQRYDYRPVERHQRRHNDDLRVRILYDLHL